MGLFEARGVKFGAGTFSGLGASWWNQGVDCSSGLLALDAGVHPMGTACHGASSGSIISWRFFLFPIFSALDHHTHAQPLHLGMALDYRASCQLMPPSHD